MLDFIVKNYIIIVIVGAFLIFALIGFAVDTAKNKSKKEAEILNQPNDNNEEGTIVNEVATNEVVEEPQKEESIDNNIEIPEAESVNMNTDN